MTCLKRKIDYLGEVMSTRLINTLIVVLLFPANHAIAQQTNKLVREGNRYYEKKKYVESETSYRKAQEKSKDAFQPSFNVGDALYKQDKFDDAASLFDGLKNKNLKTEDLSRVYHNMGNSFLKEKKLTESIDAYKNALRNKPNDMETKYNLAYAMKLLEQQKQNKNKQNKDQKQNQDKDKNNQYKKNQDKKDQNKKDQNKNNKDEQKNQQQQQQNQQKQGISREDAQRILQSLQNDEKQLLEKLKKQQPKTRKAASKDW